GGAAAGAGGVGVGEVEGAVEAGQVQAVDVTVEGPARRGGRGEVAERGAADPAIETAGDGQERVAGGLEVEAATVEPPVGGILRVEAVAVGTVVAGLLIGGGE